MPGLSLPLAKSLTALGNLIKFVILLLKFSDSDMGIYVLSWKGAK